MPADPHNPGQHRKKPKKQHEVIHLGNGKTRRLDDNDGCPLALIVILGPPLALGAAIVGGVVHYT